MRRPCCLHSPPLLMQAGPHPCRRFSQRYESRGPCGPTAHDACFSLPRARSMKGAGSGLGKVTLRHTFPGFAVQARPERARALALFAREALLPKLLLS